MTKKSIYIITVGILVLLFLISMSPAFSITSVNVQGNEIVPTDEILTDADLMVLNKNIFLYPANKYEKKLKQNAYFKGVKVKKTFPNKIDITIDERVINFYVLYSNNTYLYMDNDAVVMDVSQNFTKNCPIIKGLDFDTFTLGETLEVKNQDAFDSAITIAKTIKRYGEYDVPIVVNVQDPDNINIIINNINIVFGDISDCDIKVRRCIAAIPYIEPELKGYLYVDDVSRDAYFKIIT